MMNELKWVITNDFGKKAPCALDVKLDGWLEYTAFIKWDGCCEVTKTDSRDDEDYTIHICDIPQFIKILQSLEDFRMNNIEGAE